MDQNSIVLRIHKMKQRGFTLIELLVSITIIVLMAGGGIAAYINFNDKQVVMNAAKELQGYLRSAQTLARVGQKPASCDKLEGYKITAVNSEVGPTVTMAAVCQNGNIVRNTYELGTKVSLNNNLNVTFLGLHGGATWSGTVEIANEAGLTYVFSISQGGEITQGDFQ